MTRNKRSNSKRNNSHNNNSSIKSLNEQQSQLSNTNNENSNVIKKKCLLCINKDSFLKSINDAIKCIGCESYYHPGCVKRTGVNLDGTFIKCCGKKDLPNDSNFDNSNLSTMNSTMLDTVNEPSGELVNEELKLLHEKLKFEIYKSTTTVSSKCDKLFVNYQNFKSDVYNDIMNLQEKVISLEEKIDNLNVDSQTEYNQESFFIEMNNRLAKEGSIVIITLKIAIRIKKIKNL